MESDLLNEVACRLFDWRRFTKVARVQADLKYIWLQMLMLQQFCSLVAGYKYGNIANSGNYTIIEKKASCARRTNYNLFYLHLGGALGFYATCF